MKKLVITQVKSSIDRPERQKLTLKALGLNKMNASREVEATEQILGMIRTVNHLLKVVESDNQSEEVQFKASEEPVEDVLVFRGPVAQAEEEVTA